MKIGLDALQVFRVLFKAIPLKTPNRTEIIKSHAATLLENSGWQKDGDQIITIHDEETFQETNFNFTVNDILLLEHNLRKTKLSLQLTDVPLILLPTDNFCCGSLLHLQSYFASVTVYDINQVTVAKSFHSRCKKCKRTFSYGFTDDKNGMLFTFFTPTFGFAVGAGTKAFFSYDCPI